MISVFTSGYVNLETILHFFYKITNERGTKTVFTYAYVKWFYGQSERAYYLNYFIIVRSSPIISFNLSIEKSHAFVNQPPLSSKKTRK